MDILGVNNQGLTSYSMLRPVNGAGLDVVAHPPMSKALVVKVMRFLVTVLTILSFESSYAIETLVCTPTEGAKNYKHGKLFKIIREGSDVRLENASAPDEYWNYEIYFRDSELGFRAVRQKNDEGGSTANMFNIAAGGSLYVMKNFGGNNKISAVATYANAFREDNDFGFMRMLCVE